ncbi:hypothetical protein TNIN_92431, partial [Trichonephila inaurata madagascariensis]
MFWTLCVKKRGIPHLDLRVMAFFHAYAWIKDVKVMSFYHHYRRQFKSSTACLELSTSPGVFQRYV